LRVVVEHLLEVGDGPRPVYAVAMESTPQVVVEAPACHGAERSHQGARGAGHAVVCGEQEQFQGRGLGELLALPLAPVPRVMGPHQRGDCPLVPSAVDPLLVRREGSADDPLQRVAPAPQRGALLVPGRSHLVKHLAEGRHPVPGHRWKVGDPREGPQVGKQEQVGGPSGIALEREERLDVDGVHVRAFLPVHLDGHEMGVEESRHLWVREGLMLHHMAPVAGRIADREQDRPVLAPRLLEGLRCPGVPVHRVVGVLQEVGTGLVDKAVGPRGVALRANEVIRRGNAIHRGSGAACGG